MKASRTAPATNVLVQRPPKKRAKPLIRSAGIRLALVYATVFGLSAFALAFSLWYSTVGLLQRQVEIAIRNDGAALQDHFAVGGIQSLILAIEGRLQDNIDNDAIYMLVDPLNNRIAGNLIAWPPGLNGASDEYQLTVNRSTGSSVAMLVDYHLQGGYQLVVGRDVRAFTELRHLLQAGLLWAMGIMSVLGIVGAFVIRSLFRRMIRDISATTRAISRGDLTRRVPKTGDGDEFDELAGIINDMLDRITKLMDGVREVSNSIAHDLRTPITRARTRLEDAALHASSPDDLKSAIERATDDLDGIVAVFQALLRIAEIEAGARRSAFAPFDVAPLLSDIDEFYHAVAEERGITLVTDIAGPLPLLGDRELIQQAVANLLDNALKFSPVNTSISLTAMLHNDSIELSIADQGPGISEADRDRATERFFRAESARHTNGSGLGLALVAAVASLHTGTLRLRDNHPGLRAILTLPAQLGDAVEWGRFK
jgi:signal transduction histidine kinase